MTPGLIASSSYPSLSETWSSGHTPSAAALTDSNLTTMSDNQDLFTEDSLGHITTSRVSSAMKARTDNQAGILSVTQTNMSWDTVTAQPIGLLGHIARQSTSAGVHDDGTLSSASLTHPVWLISLMVFLIGVSICMAIIWVARRRGDYTRLKIEKDKAYDYIYKPNGVLDDEYENTFVGVSVPLLQEITII